MLTAARRFQLARLPLLAVIAVLLTPLGYLLLRALASGAGGAALLRPRTLDLLLDTALLTLLVATLSGAMGLLLAWLIGRAELRWRQVWLVLLTAPVVIPSYVSAFSLIALTSPRGVAQTLLGPLFAVDQLPSIHGLPGSVIALTSICYPFVLLPALAAFHRCDVQLEDAARVLGSGPVNIFRRVVFPAVLPSAAAGALIVALYAIGDFGAVSLLDYDSIASAIYARYEYSLDRSAAAWYSLLLVLGALALVLLERARRPATAGWDARADLAPPRYADLGPWKAPVYGFMGATVLVAFGLPLSMLVYWAISGASAGFDILALARLAGGSLAVALAAAVACAIFAGPLAWLCQRRPGPLTRAIETAAAINYAIPGIALGLALVLLASRALPLIYQSFYLLVFAYVLHSLPLALGSLRASLNQVGEQLEDVARVLGRSLPIAIWRVTLPLVRPGLFAGAGLVFLATSKELPITLLLRPTGFKTLAIEVWSAADAGALGAAGLAGLLLLLLALPQVALLLSGLRR